MTSTTIPHALNNFTDVSNTNENNGTTTNVIEDSSPPTTPRDNETTTDIEVSNGTTVTWRFEKLLRKIHNKTVCSWVVSTKMR